MQSTRITSLGISISLLILGLVACSGAAVPEASSTPTTAQPTVSEPTDTPTSTPVPTATSVPTPTIAPTPTPEPIKLSGTGQQASSKFDLNQGLAIFEMTHDGQSNFAIQLLDNQGNFVDLLVNEIGTFNGSKVLGIEEFGPHILSETEYVNLSTGVSTSHHH